MVSKEEVEHIAKLARLGLSEKEIEKMQKELTKILDYIDSLKELDISKTEPTSGVDFLLLRGRKPLEKAMREDQVKEQPPETVNNLLEAAPSKEKGYIKVPEILKF